MNVDVARTNVVVKEPKMYRALGSYGLDARDAQPRKARWPQRAACFWVEPTNMCFGLLGGLSLPVLL
jgi:hypothetical protein